MNSRTLTHILKTAFLCFFGGLLFATPQVANSQFTYTTNNRALTITGYTGSGGDVTIPDKINDLPVISIGDLAFLNQSNLTNVTIPNGAVNIGFRAFEGCTSLTNIVIPNNVSAIGSQAFFRCVKLASVSLPGSLTRIQGNTFWACSSLMSITIPNSVTTILDQAFAGCIKMTSATIGNNVTNIAYRAFYDCRSLARLEMGSKVVSIGEGAFSACASLTDFTIPTNLVSIGWQSFHSCSRLTSLALPNSVTSIAYGAFWGCSGVTNLSIPSSVKSIGEGAFYGEHGLTSVTIPASVTNLGSGVFSGCSRLAAITTDALNPAYCTVDGVLFDKSRKMILQYPAGKVGSNYSIPASVTSIDKWSFTDCERLSDIVIPFGVTLIRDYAFYFCTNLTRVYFKGNAPQDGWLVLDGSNSTVFYLPGATGWGLTFAERPTALWLPEVLTGDASFGVRTNQFGFNIAWAGGQAVVVDACTNVANPIWSPLQTNVLSSDSFYFSDPAWTNFTTRSYRLRSP